MVSENVPTANGHKRCVAIRQKPHPLLKNPQIKGLCTKKVETTKTYIQSVMPQINTDNVSTSFIGFFLKVIEFIF